MKRIQVIVSDQYDPFLNRAVEQYLTEQQEEGIVTLYLWKNQRTVVIGYNQNPYAECNVQLLLDEGGHLMRRGTGGGAVYHDLGNINFSFIADRKLYDVRRQLAVVQKALSAWGLDTEISGRNDLTCRGRKFSGNAFAKGQVNNLHHGTLLIKTDGAMMQRYLIVDKAKLLKNGVKSVASRVVNLSELVPELTSENIKQPLITAFENTYESTATTTKKARFPWGGVESALQVNEANATITDIQIASDCLDTESIGEAERMLKGSSTKVAPMVDDGQEIIKDIIELVYGE